MGEEVTENYRSWRISVCANENMCAKFSFAITAPDGHTQHVPMGGENELRALERAREMVDMEIALSDDK